MATRILHMNGDVEPLGKAWVPKYIQRNPRVYIATLWWVAILARWPTSGGSELTWRQQDQVGDIRADCRWQAGRRLVKILFTHPGRFLLCMTHQILYIANDVKKAMKDADEVATDKISQGCT